MGLRNVESTDDALFELGKRVTSYGWVADGITGDEWIPLVIIGDTAKLDLETARLLVNASWVADSVSIDERQGMNALTRIAGVDPAVARLAFDQPFMAPPFRHRDALALCGLERLVQLSADPRSDYMALIARQPWFEDGVDDMEAALLRVLEIGTDQFMRALIESHYIASSRIHLPLTGDVNLVAIGHTPFPLEDSTLLAMEEGIRAIEGFTGRPFPVNDVILLVVDPDIWERRPSGSVVGDYEPGFDSRMILVNDRKVFDREGDYEGVIYHELGHFYFPMTPRWLSEGGAEFGRAYTRDKTGAESIEQRFTYLNRPRIHTPDDITVCDKQNIWQHQEDYRPNNCDYYLGEIFLLAMYEVLGERGVSSAVRDLKTQIELTREAPHPDLIYQAFEKYTPQGKEDDFQAAYRRYHGGPITALAAPSLDWRTALAALYKAAHGLGWEHSDNWLSEMPLSSWYGVIAAAGDQVTGLALANNELTGEIPPGLGLLTNLQELNLSSNELAGAIPQELGGLTNLKVLMLGDNQLAGEIPAEFGALTNLEDLRLGGSPLTGTIPSELGNLLNLGILDLSVARLSGEIPSELSRLTNLRGLDLSTNQLSGKIPPELGSLSSKLWRLDLSGNLLTGEIPPELSELTGLGFLNLSSNQLVGEIPLELGNFPDLTRVLDLSGNQLSGEIPPELARLTEVGRINLSGNQLVGEIPPELGGLTELGALYLSENRLSGEIPPELGSLSSLWRLNLSGNQLTGQIPRELGGLTEIKTLDLRQNRLTGEIPPELGTLHNLTELFLDGNRFTGCIPSSLRAIPDSDLGNLGLPYCAVPE